MLLAIKQFNDDRLQSDGPVLYSVRELFNKTLEKDAKTFASVQDITVGRARHMRSMSGLAADSTLDLPSTLEKECSV